MAPESTCLRPAVRRLHLFDSDVHSGSLQLTAQRYRYAADLTPDQKDALLDVVRATPHAQISPEVRRELVNSTVRGEPRPEADGDIEMS